MFENKIHTRKFLNTLTHGIIVFDFRSKDNVRIRFDSAENYLTETMEIEPIAIMRMSSLEKLNQKDFREFLANVLSYHNSHGPTYKPVAIVFGNHAMTSIHNTKEVIKDEMA